MIPPRFRLNCDQIEAGLIMNRCKIGSESPLERRKYIEEEIEKIHFNQCDFDTRLINATSIKPNLRVNRFSSVIRSFLMK